jgi:hypothetical protein
VPWSLTLVTAPSSLQSTASGTASTPPASGPRYGAPVRSAAAPPRPGRGGGARRGTRRASGRRRRLARARRTARTSWPGRCAPPRRPRCPRRRRAAPRAPRAWRRRARAPRTTRRTAPRTPTGRRRCPGGEQQGEEEPEGHFGNSQHSYASSGFSLRPGETKLEDAREWNLSRVWIWRDGRAEGGRVERRTQTRSFC